MSALWSGKRKGGSEKEPFKRTREESDRARNRMEKGSREEEEVLSGEIGRKVINKEGKGGGLSEANAASQHHQ